MGNLEPGQPLPEDYVLEDGEGKLTFTLMSQGEEHEIIVLLNLGGSPAGAEHMIRNCAQQAYKIALEKAVEAKVRRNGHHS